MKFIIDRDFRNISLNPEWITIDLQKEKWKRFGSKSNYLDNMFDSNWRVIFAGKNRLFSDETIVDMIKKSINNYFSTDESLSQLATEIQLPQNLNLKRKEKIDSISRYTYEIEINAIFEWLISKNIEVKKNQIEEYLLSHSDFFYTIPFIDESQIISWADRKQVWDSNSVKSFLRNNLLIQVKFSSLKNNENGIALFLRKDLKLGKGKAGAQLSHGIISLLYQPTFKNTFVDEFIKQEQKNILIYSISDFKVLQEIEHLCRKLKVNNSLIIDAGHTQIEPGTATCIGVGPIAKIWLEILAFNMEAVELR